MSDFDGVGFRHQKGDKMTHKMILVVAVGLLWIIGLLASALMYKVAKSFDESCGSFFIQVIGICAILTVFLIVQL